MGGGKLLICKSLILESFLGGKGYVNITIGNNAKLIFENDFIIGQNVKILVHDGGVLTFGGKLHETGSGITADSIVMCKERITVGTDLICSWNVFLTDCDWHKMIMGNISCPPSKPVKIGNHVWIGSNVVITKGSLVEDNAIIAAFSKISNQEVKGGGVSGGIPIYFIKDNVTWRRDM